MEKPFRIGPWRVQPARNVISRDGQEKRLENRVMQTLVFLARHPGEAISRERFFSEVWQGLVVNEEALSRVISLLRSALEDSAQDPRFIQTIPGVGYRLIAEVAEGDGTSRDEPRAAAAIARAGHRRRITWGLAAAALLLCVAGWYLGTRQANRGPTAAAPEQAAPAEPNSLAVLPFVNMSPDPGQEYIADGMTEELLNMLANVPGLRVTARTSSFFFKGKNLPVREIADILNVRHILEGSIRRSGGKVRITAQLVEAQSDRHLWSKTYDRDEADLFAIQDDVAAAIVQALTHSLEAANAAKSPRSASLAAFEAFRTGRLLWWRRTPADFQAAIGYFEKSVKLDPGFAPAYAALADTWMLLVMHGNVHIVKGEELAEGYINQALQLDPSSAEAYAARGLSRLIVGRKSEAEVDLRQALDLNPRYIPAYLWLGVLLGDLGRVAEQNEVLSAAIAMDPLNEMLAVYYAENLRTRGDAQGARDSLGSLLRLEPNHPRLLVALSEALLSGGDLVNAVEIAQKDLRLHPDNVFVINQMGQAWTALGDFDRADAVWREGRRRNPNSVELKVAYLGMLIAGGRVDEAHDLMGHLFPEDISTLQKGYQRTYHHFQGLLCYLEADLACTRDEFEQVIDRDERQLYDRDQVFVLTMASLINAKLGQGDAAEQELQQAERAMGHARVNGVDDADFYYNASSILVMRGDLARALDSLQKAYDKGFRRQWLLDQDPRLDPLRDKPEFQAIRDRIANDLAEARSKILNGGAGKGSE